MSKNGQNKQKKGIIKKTLKKSEFLPFLALTLVWGYDNIMKLSDERAAVLLKSEAPKI